MRSISQISLFLHLSGKDFWFPAEVLNHEIQNFFADTLSLKFLANKIFFIGFLLDVE